VSTSTNLVSGLSSGFDWRSMVDQLIAIDQQRVTIIENDKTRYENQLSEWQSFNTKLLSLKTAAEALTDPESFAACQSSLSADGDSAAEDLVSVSVSDSAAPGFYSMTVEETAAAQRLLSTSFESSTEELGLSGDIEINGVTVTLDESDSLDALREKINNADADVTASVVSYETDDHRLSLTSAETGAEGISLDGASDILTTLGFTEISAGRDAVLDIDGVTITRSSNVIEDVIEGVTIDLVKADPLTDITLMVERDINAVSGKINNFVSAYNAVSTYINEQQNYDAETGETGGVLFGDGTLASVKSDLVNTVLDQVVGVDADFSLLNFAGITLDETGMLTVDDAVLDDYLESNFNDIVGLFAAQGATEGENLEFVHAGSAVEAGTYAISIDQAASQGTATGTVDLTGGLGADATLTVAVSGYRAVVDLDAGMAIDDIVSAVNTELEAAQAEIRVGSEFLYAGSGELTPLTAETAWDQVYVGGTAANLENGDTISFSGTDHQGGAVSGSYEINDVTTDTVQGLLSAVEAAYGGDATASIDSEGRIVIEDSEDGRSKLTLAFDTSGAGGLTFGDIDVSSDGSDGSRAGRTALAVSASDDGSGNLVLTNDNYGTSAAFTVEQFGAGSLGLVDGEYAGEDVSGTINGEEATGSGQVLTGASDADMTAGLSIKYTGDAPLETAGTVTFIEGVAEKFSRSLSAITDPVDGYVTFKRQSLTSTIDSYDDRIERINELLERKAQRMIDRFVAMELALSKIQSQSDWLAGQISAAQSGWEFNR